MRILSLNKARRLRELIGLATGRKKTRPAQARLCNVKVSRFTSTADSPNSIRRALQKDAAEIQSTSPEHLRARIEHLIALKTAIAEGRYQVSAADLAQKLMDHLLVPRPVKKRSPRNPPPKN